MASQRSLTEKIRETCTQDEFHQMMNPNAARWFANTMPASTILLLQKLIDGQEEILRELRKLTQRRPSNRRS